MFSIVKKAGLSIPEFALIVGVSRIAAYNWIAKANPTKPHKMIALQVKRALTLLKILVERGKLPLHDGLDRESRRAQIMKIKQVLNSNA